MPKPSGIEQFVQRRPLAGDCLPPKFIEGLPWRKQSLKLDEPVVKTDPFQTHAVDTKCSKMRH